MPELLINKSAAIEPAFATGTRPSPRRAVNVRSPLKYSNGVLQMPEENIDVPFSDQKFSSSFNVIEGRVSHENRNGVKNNTVEQP